MDKFEKRYGIAEDENVRAFHRSRRMFCIKDGKVYIAKPNLPYSHAVWFEKKGWKATSSFMDKTVRGFVSKNGDVFFFVGYGFRVNRRAEFIFLSLLKELAGKLRIKHSARVYGGMIKQKGTTQWPARKCYGTVKKYIN